MSLLALMFSYAMAAPLPPETYDDYFEPEEEASTDLEEAELAEACEDECYPEDDDEPMED